MAVGQTNKNLHVLKFFRKHSCTFKYFRNNSSTKLPVNVVAYKVLSLF